VCVYVCGLGGVVYLKACLCKSQVPAHSTGNMSFKVLLLVYTAVSGMCIYVCMYVCKASIRVHSIGIMLFYCYVVVVVGMRL
jgi:hypothetical protein